MPRVRFPRGRVDGLIPTGSLPVAIEDSPLLESLRDTAGFAEVRQEVARRRAIMKRRVEAMRDQLGLAAGTHGRFAIGHYG